jgi:hypothetical protein
MKKMNNKSPFSPWCEFRRYGYLKHDWKLLLFWVATSFVLAIIVPAGQSANLFQYLTFHIAMAGFGATVFGFTILGGKDDFFEPIIKEKKDGVNTLRNMVLYLFVPLVLHGVACVIIALRILFPMLTQFDFLRFSFRFIYGSVAIWATAQTFFSYRFLFILAVTRLVWKYKQVYHSQGNDGQTVSSEQKESQA